MSKDFNEDVTVHGHVTVDNETEVAGKHKYVSVIDTVTGTVMRYITAVWDGSAWVPTEGFALGRGAAEKSSGKSVVAIGSRAAYNVDKEGIIAIGKDAGLVTNGAKITSIGNAAGTIVSGDNNTMIGNSAGLSFCGNDSTMIGSSAQNVISWNTPKSVTVQPSDIDVAANTIHVASGVASWGVDVGKFVTIGISASAGGAVPRPIADKFSAHTSAKIVDANTLYIVENLQDQGSGTLTIKPMRVVERITAVGSWASCGDSDAVAIGFKAHTNGPDSIAIGPNTFTEAGRKEVRLLRGINPPPSTNPLAPPQPPAVTGATLWVGVEKYISMNAIKATVATSNDWDSFKAAVAAWT